MPRQTPPATSDAPGEPAAAVPREPVELRVARAGLPPVPRHAWAEIDLATLAANARTLRGVLPPGTALGVVVKADGYGHGLLAAARAAILGGAAMLVVATLDEALALRDADVTTRILVSSPVRAGLVGLALAARLDVVAADEGSLAALEARLRASGVPALRHDRSAARVHLAIDTGMTRGGFTPEEAVSVARRLLASGLPRLAGTWSHLASPEDPASIEVQVGRFEDALAGLRAAGIHPGLRHLDATGGVVARSGPAYDLVRVGLAFYGLVPPELTLTPARAGLADGLRPALSLHARAATVARVPAGTSVGYGGTWTAPRDSVVATLPFGYADGWARACAAGWGVVRGARVPLVGRVSSDAIAVDVTDVTGWRDDDEVTLLGAEKPAMTAHDLAGLRGSIAWEVLDALAGRLPRIYTEGGVPVGARYLDGRTRIARASWSGQGHPPSPTAGGR